MEEARGSGGRGPSLSLLRISPDVLVCGGVLNTLTRAAQPPQMSVGGQGAKGDPVFIVLTIWGNDSGKGRDGAY